MQDSMLFLRPPFGLPNKIRTLGRIAPRNNEQREFERRLDEMEERVKRIEVLVGLRSVVDGVDPEENESD